MTVSTYRLTASNGRHIRIASMVTLDDGREIRFTERLTKREAIKQAEWRLTCEQRAACPHPGARLYTWPLADGGFGVGCCACGKVLSGGVEL